MDRIAFIYGETFLYWSSIVLTLAAAVAVCVFLALYLGKGGSGTAAAVAIPMAMVLSLVLARYQHWYCRADSYSGFLAAMTDYSSGGYALMGVFAGCALAAALLRAAKVCRNLPEMLDCMSIAGTAGIALGRLACFFNSADRGQIVSSVTALPWVYPVTNTVSGAVEYRLATFVIQAMVAGVLFLGLLVFYLRGQRRGGLKDGDACLVFLLCYGASQVVLDSTRYDSLFFRSNGFVSIVQVLGALGIALAVVVFSVRMVKARGWKFWYLGLWLGIAGLLGCAGYMEYHVQRHGDQAVFAYSMMSVSLLAVIALTLVIRFLAVQAKGRKKAMEHMNVCGKEYGVLRLLGKGKGGYSYLVTDGEGEYVLKQIHHEPCDYYQFGDKLASELRDYERLSAIGIPMPRLLAVDQEQERLLKEYIPGDTIDRLVAQDRMEPDYFRQMEEMCRLLYPANTNIDYFPTNFVVRDGKLYYVDFECNDYMEEWNFENWGVAYWSKTPEFLAHFGE